MIAPANVACWAAPSVKAVVAALPLVVVWKVSVRLAPVPAVMVMLPAPPVSVAAGPPEIVRVVLRVVEVSGVVLNSAEVAYVDADQFSNGTKSISAGNRHAELAHPPPWNRTSAPSADVVSVGEAAVPFAARPVMTGMA